MLLIGNTGAGAPEENNREYKVKKFEEKLVLKLCTSCLANLRVQDLISCNKVRDLEELEIPTGRIMETLQKSRQTKM